jgi:hypothetical protein
MTTDHVNGANTDKDVEFAIGMARCCGPLLALPTSSG